MAKLIDCVAYILIHYPHKDELSNARVTKMLYLADWHSLINGHASITGINWYFDTHGPFVWDVKDAIDHSRVAEIEETRNAFGSKKNLIKLKDRSFEPALKKYEKLSLDHIIAMTKTLYFPEFITLVYSTYPVTSGTKYGPLDLERKASEYRKRRGTDPVEG